MDIEFAPSDISINMKYAPVTSRLMWNAFSADTNQFKDLTVAHLNLKISKCRYIVSKIFEDDCNEDE